MPPVEGCNKQDCAVLFMVGVAVEHRRLLATANPSACGRRPYSMGIITFFRNAGRSVRR